MEKRNPYTSQDEESLAIRDLIHDANGYLSNLHARVVLLRQFIKENNTEKIEEFLTAIDKADKHVQTIDEFYDKWVHKFDGKHIHRQRFIKKMKSFGHTEEEALAVWNGTTVETETTQI